MTRASTWYYSVNVPPPHEGTADPSLVGRFTCILGALRRRPRHFSPHYLISLSATLYGRWREANICFVPDLTSYRTPTSKVTVFILAQLPWFFFSFLSFITLFFSPHQEFLVLGQCGRSGGPWREYFVSDY